MERKNSKIELTNLYYCKQCNIGYAATDDLLIDWINHMKANHQHDKEAVIN